MAGAGVHRGGGSIALRAQRGEAALKLRIGEGADPEALLAGRLSRNQLDFGALHAEQLGKEVPAGAVGGALDRSRSTGRLTAIGMGGRP